MSHWIMSSNDSFRRLIHSRMKQVPVLMNRPLNHWLRWFKIMNKSWNNCCVLLKHVWLLCCDLCLELFSLTKWSKNSQRWQYILSINSNSNIELKRSYINHSFKCQICNRGFQGTSLLVVSCCLTRLYVIYIKTKIHFYDSSVCSCVHLFWFLHEIVSHRQAAWASTGATLLLLIIHYQSPFTRL